MDEPQAEDNARKAAPAFVLAPPEARKVQDDAADVGKGKDLPKWPLPAVAPETDTTPISEPEPVAPEASPAPAPAKRLPIAKRWLVVGGVALCVLIIVGIVFASGGESDEPSSAQQAARTSVGAYEWPEAARIAQGLQPFTDAALAAVYLMPGIERPAATEPTQPKPRANKKRRKRRKSKEKSKAKSKKKKSKKKSNKKSNKSSKKKKRGKRGNRRNKRR